MAAFKRLAKDILEIQSNPIPHATFHLPDETNMRHAHSTIKIMDGIYKGLLIHIRIEFPERYPLDPPAVYIVNGFPFDHSFHEHVHSNGSVCVDISSNYKEFFRGFKNSGWSPAFNIKYLILQLGIFFADPDLPQKFVPTESKIHDLFEQVSKFKCQTCPHTTAVPFPPFATAAAVSKELPPPSTTTSILCQEQQQQQQQQQEQQSQEQAQDQPKKELTVLPPKAKVAVKAVVEEQKKQSRQEEDGSKTQETISLITDPNLIRNLNYRQLQIQLKARKLPATGKTKELLERLLLNL